MELEIILRSNLVSIFSVMQTYLFNVYSYLYIYIYIIYIYVHMYIYIHR